MAGILEQLSKGLFGLAPIPAPNGVFGQVLDSAAQWGRGVQDKAATLADLLKKPLPMEGRAAFLPFQDTLPGSVMNQRSSALPGVLASALNAFTAPARSTQGGYLTDEDGNIRPAFDAPEEAQNFALSLAGANGLTPPAPSGALGMLTTPFKLVGKKQNLIKEYPASGELPISDSWKKLPNPAYGYVGPDITIKRLEDGQFLIENSPQWMAKGKNFYAIGNDPEELVTLAKQRVLNSEKSIISAEKKKYDNSLIGMLTKEFGDHFQTAKSARSASEYITHTPSGTKIRISDHDLPLGYVQPDIDLRHGMSAAEKMAVIKKYLRGD